MGSERDRDAAAGCVIAVAGLLLLMAMLWLLASEVSSSWDFFAACMEEHGNFWRCSRGG